jgi:hypothetical protein
VECRRHCFLFFVEERIMIVRLGARGFGIAFFISVCLFYLITQLRLESCYDCFRPHGFPFTYFHEGGYAGGSAWVWPGVIGDLFCVLGLATLIVWIWNYFISER